MGELTSQGKPFSISKPEVWEAYRQVKPNKGAPGVDGQSLEGFEADLKDNLFKIGSWAATLRKEINGGTNCPTTSASNLPWSDDAGSGFMESEDQLS